MMNETLIIFSREWAVTAALAAYLAPAYSRPAAVVHGLAQLVRVLEEQPFAPVVLGLRPHEHVSGLYRLQPLLSDRAVLFVGRCFYWTDYNLPEWLGMERYGFCTWDAMQHPFSRRMELRRFRQFAADTPDNVSWPTPVASPPGGVSVRSFCATITGAGGCHSARPGSTTTGTIWRG